MQITLLGTGAPLMPDRATTGMLVTAPGCEPLLLDTCGGFELVRQLASVGVALGTIKNVIVTHRHMDHAGGMQALYLARMPLEIHASADTHAGIATMTAGCFPEWERHDGVHHHEMADGTRTDIGGFEVAFFAVQHRVPTLAVRIQQGGKTFAFSADSLPCEALVACARNADLFVCDAICAEADGDVAAKRARELMHPTAREAATMATRASTARLVCTHIGRFGSPERILAEAQAHFAGEVVVPVDGATLTV
jgi:ribonuclease BN (tRNA processing enzyme)